MGNYNSFDEMRAQQQALTQQQLSAALGGLSNLIGYSDNTGNTQVSTTDWTTTATGTEATVNWQQLVPQYTHQQYTNGFSVQQPTSPTVTYKRLSNDCVHHAGQNFIEPLDELRVNVAKWLNRQ